MAGTGDVAWPIIGFASRLTLTLGQAALSGARAASSHRAGTEGGMSLITIGEFLAPDQALAEGTPALRPAWQMLPALDALTTWVTEHHREPRPGLR